MTTPLLYRPDLEMCLDACLPGVSLDFEVRSREYDMIAKTVYSVYVRGWSNRGEMVAVNQEATYFEVIDVVRNIHKTVIHRIQSEN